MKKMATLWASTMVVMILALTPANSETGVVDSVVKTIRVFEKGSIETTTTTVETRHSSAPPHSLVVVSPLTAGIYPVLLFVHGTMIPNRYYSTLFQHIASHGFIVVAPQLYLMPMPSQPTEIERAVAVANWLATKLQQVLPKGVEADVRRLALSGHSRGAKTAFSIALGEHKAPLQVKISALIGVDPVAGTSKRQRTKPYILTYEPNSFDLSIPITVIGTGLGNHSAFIFGPSCAPNDVNHEEFFDECKQGTHFVIKDYGHMDMLNDGIAWDLPMGPMVRGMCKNGKGNDDLMRRTLGGIIVAFLDAYFLDETDEFGTILAHPSVAPARIYPAKTKGIVAGQAQSYAQV